MPTTAQAMIEAAHAEVPKITAAEAKALVENNGALIVDIRDGTEVASTGKIKGAVHISRGGLESRACPESSTHNAELRTDRTIILHCAGGNRAALAGKTLLDLGFKDVRNLGGFRDWVAAGYDIEK